MCGLERQTEAKLRGAHLRGGVLQELRGRALDRADAPVRTIERVEDFENRVQRHAAAQRHALLETDVGLVLHRCEQIVARNDRAVWTQALAEVRTRASYIAAVGVRLTDTGGEEVQRAQLEALAHLPDAVQHHTVALVVRRQAPLTAEIRDGVHRQLLESAERLRVGVPQARQRVRGRALPPLAEALGHRRLQGMVGRPAEVRVHRDDAPIRVGARGAFENG